MDPLSLSTSIIASVQAMFMLTHQIQAYFTQNSLRGELGGILGRLRLELLSSAEALNTLVGLIENQGGSVPIPRAFPVVLETLLQDLSELQTVIQKLPSSPNKISDIMI